MQQVKFPQNILMEKEVLLHQKLNYEGNSISKLQIVIEKNRMEIMTQTTFIFQHNLHTI